MQEGDFEMKHIDKVGSSTFNVAIAPFSLSIIGDDDDAPLWRVNVIRVEENSKGSVCCLHHGVELYVDDA